MSLADLERAWEHYGKRGVPWSVWKAQQLNQFWTRNDPRVSTPNFRPETIRHGESASDCQNYLGGDGGSGARDATLKPSV